MDNDDRANTNDEVFDVWNFPDITLTATSLSNLEDNNIQSNKYYNDSKQSRPTISSSNFIRLPCSAQERSRLGFAIKQEECQYHQWPTSSAGLLKLPTCKWNPTRQNVISGSLNRSISLVNLNSKFVSNLNNLVDRYTLSVPSSPDSLYCDSLCGSGDLSSPTSSPRLSRSLSCDVLAESGAFLKQSRSNSSDSAVVMLTDDEPRFSECHFEPQSPSVELEKDMRAQEDQEKCGNFQIPSPLFAMPSVVVSDHSDFYPSFDDYSSFEDSLCGDSHIQYWHQFRKFSDCSSTSSITSTQSLDDEESDEQLLRSLDVEKCLVPSGWRKVRNIVHWSPFVQTYKKQKYPWVQLAGHKGSFKPGEHGTILKKLCLKEEQCLMLLMKDKLHEFVPEYKGRIIGTDDEMYLQLQDLLKDFDDPCVMDCKIGVRTYLEDELSKAKEKAKLRKDMYEKMIQVDSAAATDEENRMKGVTKPRYMVWRETISSTATLGFRIDGMKRSNGLTSKDFKMTKTLEQVTHSFRIFIEGYEYVTSQYVRRLQELRSTLDRSNFFLSHELIGSSLLFVHDKVKANIWMIDFAKTQDVPEGIKIDHKTPWNVGNHEDGYLIGVDNLINIFSSL